jgi:hypothetical protein
VIVSKFLSYNTENELKASNIFWKSDYLIDLKNTITLNDMTFHNYHIEHKTVNYFDHDTITQILKDKN